MAKAESRRIAVLGAGPIGLEAALYGRHLGFAVTVYERGQVADSLRRWGHVRLFSPFGWNSTPLGRAALRGADLPGENDCISGIEYANSYLTPLSQCELLKGHIQTETQVIQVGRSNLLKTDSPGENKRGEQPFRLLVRKGQAERIDEADIVLDCTGTYAYHRWMGEGGIPAVGEVAHETNLCYHLDDILGAKKSSYASKSIVLVGSGYSAATSACLLASLAEQHPDMWVVWLARGPRKQPLPRIPNDPLKERDRLAVRANSLATRGDGNLEFHPLSTIQLVEWRNNAFRVIARVNGKERTWDVDRVIANVGYQPDMNICRELQIQECHVWQGPLGVSTALAKQNGGDGTTLVGGGPASLRTSEPNFFILGAKSFGRNSHFLLRAGFEQIRELFTLIGGKPDLDLYKLPKP
jgi:thioredoxin reductase